MPSLTLRIPPLAVVAVAALLMWLIARATPPLTLSYPEHAWLAWACVVLGLLAVGTGVTAFHRARTTVNPLSPESASAIVSSGVYRLSRNPMYLGFLLLLAGWAAYLGNVASLIVLPAYVLYMNRFQILPEEEALASKFGEAYLAYKHRVRRWL